RARSRGAQRRRSEGTDAGGLDDQLWTLAERATKERARWKGDPDQGALLMAATAAGQDLARRSSPKDGRNNRESRVARRRELQAGCEQEIRCAHNGPYLVTNPERIRNWLGEELPTWPTMALCRCGESSIKPICDGACASSGFSDRKDPKRVPDR